VVLDADIRSDDPAHQRQRSAWRELVGDMKPTVKTGGGGRFTCAARPTSCLWTSPVLKQSQDMAGNKPA
jgi:hypothetical protein